MKSKDLLLIGAVAVGAYFLLENKQDGQDFTSGVGGGGALDPSGNTFITIEAPSFPKGTTGDSVTTTGGKRFEKEAAANRAIAANAGLSGSSSMTPGIEVFRNKTGQIVGGQDTTQGQSLSAQGVATATGPINSAIRKSKQKKEAAV